jgi:hypothetical protein
MRCNAIYIIETRMYGRCNPFQTEALVYIGLKRAFSYDLVFENVSHDHSFDFHHFCLMLWFLGDFRYGNCEHTVLNLGVDGLDVRVLR